MVGLNLACGLFEKRAKREQFFLAWNPTASAVAHRRIPDEKNYINFFCKSLRLSPKNPFEWKFLKIGSIAVCSFMKIFPSLQVCRHTSVPPSALNIKVVIKLARADMVKLLPRVNMEEPTLKISTAKKHIQKLFSVF